MCLLLDDVALTAGCKDSDTWVRLTGSSPARTPSHAAKAVLHRERLTRVTGCFKGGCRWPDGRKVINFACILGESPSGLLNRALRRNCFRI